MISEQQIMALSQHLDELQAELRAVTPLFQSIQDKIEVLSAVANVMKSDLAQGQFDQEYEQSASVGFISNG